MAEPTITLWRPVGLAEMALIRESGMRAFPPRLPEQPIFYPVTTEDYAIKIARDWNVRASGSRSEEHTSELQSLMRTSYAVLCCKIIHNIQKQNSHRNIHIRILCDISSK